MTTIITSNRFARLRTRLKTFLQLLNLESPKLFDNGVQFALWLHQMHEDLHDLAAYIERGRKQSQIAEYHASASEQTDRPCGFAHVEALEMVRGFKAVQLILHIRQPITKRDFLRKVSKTNNTKQERLPAAS